MERVSCVTDGSLDRKMDNYIVSSESNDNNRIDNDPDENYEDYTEDKSYGITNNLMYDDPTRAEQEVRSKKLTEIPLDVLPCPKELMQSMEETYGHPIQNEIKLKGFSGAGLINAHNIVLNIILFVFLI